MALADQAAQTASWCLRGTRAAPGNLPCINSCSPEAREASPLILTAQLEKQGWDLRLSSMPQEPLSHV